MHNFNRLLSLLCLMLASMSTQALTRLDSGYYFNLDAGYADTHYDNNAFFQTQAGLWTVTGLRDDGFAGRASFGYAFNRNFAIETGYTYVHEAKATLIPAGGAAGTVTGMSYLFDLTGVGSLSVTSWLDIFVKGGVAYTYTELTRTGFSDTSSDLFIPLAGTGLRFFLTPHWQLNVGWLHYFKQDNAYGGFARVATPSSTTLFPGIDLFTAGVGYQF